MKCIAKKVHISSSPSFSTTPTPLQILNFFSYRASQRNMPNGHLSPPSHLNTTPTINSATQPSGTKKTLPRNGLPPRMQNGKTRLSPMNPLTTMPSLGNSTLRSRQSDKFRPMRLFTKGSSICKKSWRLW
jgi:hypothetical protein